MYLPASHTCRISSFIYFFWTLSPELYLASISYYNAHHSVVYSIPLLFGPSKAQISSWAILSSNILSLRSSLNVRDHVSHPYKTTDKIVVLYTLIFIFLDSKLENKTHSDSKRWTQFRTSIFPELYMVCEWYIKHLKFSNTAARALA
jgi:hypothetical protein